MASSPARIGLAASALLSLLLLPEALAVRPALPDHAPLLGAGAGAPSPVFGIPLADDALLVEMTHQGLKAAGLVSEDSRRLAERALPLARTEGASQELDFLAQDAVALGAVDELTARDVLARLEALVAQPVVTTDSVGRAFGVDPIGDGGSGGLRTMGSLGAGLSLPGHDADAETNAGGVCQSCPSFDYGPFTPTTADQFHAGTLSSASDCNWYSFDLVAGATYQFSTCMPGSTGFDSVLELYSGTCAFLSSADNNCPGGERIQFTATSTGSVRLKVRGFGGSTGSYNLLYRRVCIGDPDCTLPDLTLGAPTTDCQYVSGDVGDCSGAQYFHVDLVGGLTYTFSLCPATCPSAFASFDSAIEVYDDAGALQIWSFDACGDDGEVVFTPDPFVGSGTYCVVVRRESGSTTDFSMGYRVGCVAPSGVTLGPTDASTSEPDCTRNQTFNATTSGTGEFTWTWTITPGPGQSATPSGDTGTSVGTTFSFDSLLQGSGDFTVDLTVSNDCGTQSTSITYTLEDRAGPVLTPSAERVSCSTTFALPPRTSPVADLSTLTADDVSTLLAEPDPDVVAAAIAGKIRAEVKSLVVMDRLTPGVTSPPGTMALSCASPCTGFGTLEADNLFYDVFLNCDDGSYTARTGAAHSVTIDSGSPQNVIFGGAGGSPGTSDASWFVHDTNDHYINPTGGSACLFNPPDTAVEPGSIGVEAEWTRTPTGMPGVTLKLREEIVAFGDTEANSGVRLTLGATNLSSSTASVTMGVRWQIDYQNSFDDGPLFAKVVCQPFDVFDERSTEHEFTDAEIDGFDFYRIQNNTSPPIFGNFTSTTEIAGFPDTGKPDRLTYAVWGSVVNTNWDYDADEGDPSPDFDSAVLYWFGFAPADGITIDPGETFTRSVIIFTAGEEQDCGDFRAGECEAPATLEICPGECARLGATAFDGCDVATVEFVGATPGAPPCTENPCVVNFPDEGTFVYTWRAIDTAGNSVECTSTVTVDDGFDCNQPPSCSAGLPALSECREAPIEGALVEDVDGDEITYSWVSDHPMVTVEPASGVIGAGPGPRALPPTVARLDDSVDPCGVVANLTLVVDDGRGGTSSCATTATFLDVTPPVVTSTTPGGGPAVCLWPPNHWYVPVAAADLGVLVSDGCTGVSWRIVGCVSNQPEDAPERPDVDFWNGDGHTLGDCVVSDDGQTLLVRSERCGGGVDAQGGRHYGIAVVAVDACGNESAPSVAGSIHVPHDQAPAEDGCLNPTEVGFQD